MARGIRIAGPSSGCRSCQLNEEADEVARRLEAIAIHRRELAMMEDEGEHEADWQLIGLLGKFECGLEEFGQAKVMAQGMAEVPDLQICLRNQEGREEA